MKDYFSEEILGQKSKRDYFAEEILGQKEQKQDYFAEEVGGALPKKEKKPFLPRLGKGYVGLEKKIGKELLGFGKRSLRDLPEAAAGFLEPLFTTADQRAIEMGKQQAEIITQKAIEETEKEAMVGPQPPESWRKGETMQALGQIPFLGLIPRTISDPKETWYEHPLPSIIELSALMAPIVAGAKAGRRPSYIKPRLKAIEDLQQPSVLRTETQYAKEIGKPSIFEEPKLPPKKEIPGKAEIKSKNAELLADELSAQITDIIKKRGRTHVPRSLIFKWIKQELLVGGVDADALFAKIEQHIEVLKKRGSTDPWTEIQRDIIRKTPGADEGIPHTGMDELVAHVEGRVVKGGKTTIQDWLVEPTKKVPGKAEMELVKELKAKGVTEKPAGVLKKPKTAEEFLTNAEKKAKERIKKRGVRLTAGIDPAEMADYAIIGAAKIGRGTIKFADWSVEMVREFGDRIKPHLKTIYARSRQETPKFKANAELDSFMDYFEDIQAPKGFRPPRKPARSAIRERLREEGLTGKELTLETNAEFIKAVQDYGIALRKTKTGKIQPTIREAGTYVPEDFATYGKFKDAKAGSFGGTKDITRFVEEIDGALSGEARAKLPGQAGPAVRYITWRTRKMTVSRIRWTKAMRSRLKLISEGISEKQAKTANRVIEHISREGAYVDPAKLVTNPKISAITTDVNVIRFAQESRRLYESLLRHQNEFRRLIGRKEIPHRDYYTAHSIHETTIWERALGRNKTPEQVIGPGLPDYIKPNATFNPRAMARELGLPETVREIDLRVLLERYIDTAAKDVYNTAIIQNNKAFIQQLESMGYEHAARGLENWTAEAFAGVKGAADRTANLSRNVHKGMRIFRFATLRSVFPFNLRWNVLVQPSSTLLGVSRYGYRNSIRGLYDWTTNKKIRQEIRENAYSAIVKDQRSARMSQQDIVRGVGTAERLNRGKLATAADYANYFTDWVERHVTGWSVATAKRHGASIGLKGRALWEYASEGGSKVQSLYNLEDLPGMLRSEVIKTGAMFQTFKFEAFNTLREFAGKTGMPPATHAIRVKMVLRFLAGATAINYVGQVTLGRKPWELASFIPFYGQLAAPVIAAVKGEDVPMTTQRGLPVPLGIGIRGVQATHKGLLKPGVAGIKELIRTGDFNAALEEFMATGKWDKLRRFTIRYLSGYAGIPGGTQINRVVDGLIAISAGGMEDSAGKMMFPISGTKEKIRTFLGGPWSTESGQEYWDKRGKELNLDIEFLEQNPFLRDVAESFPVFGDFYKFKKDSESQTRRDIQRMIRRKNFEGAYQKRLEWNMENPDKKIAYSWYKKQMLEAK